MAVGVEGRPLREKDFFLKTLKKVPGCISVGGAGAGCGTPSSGAQSSRTDRFWNRLSNILNLTVNLFLFANTPFLSLSLQ